MTTLEQTIETIKTMPQADRQRLQLFLQEGLQEQEHPAEQPDAAALQKAERVRRELDEYRRAQEWIAAHRAEYLGQWVVLEGDRLISQGFDGHQVYDQAKAAGIAAPFFVRISAEPTHYIGGFEICR